MTPVNGRVLPSDQEVPGLSCVCPGARRNTLLVLFQTLQMSEKLLTGT